MVQTMKGPTFFPCETHWLSMQVAAHCLTLCKGCYSLLRAGGYCATLDLAQVCLEESPRVIHERSLPLQMFCLFQINTAQGASVSSYLAPKVLIVQANPIDILTWPGFRIHNIFGCSRFAGFSFVTKETRWAGTPIA
jgi:hypothetical protein